MLTPEQKAERAARILADPVFLDAVEELDDGYVRDWRTATTVEAREAAFHRQEALDAVLRQLQAITARTH